MMDLFAGAGFDMLPDAMVLTARWVFPVAGPPLERGLVIIRGGRIAAVEASGTRTADLDLGNAAIIPGLVNAHVHLDLSGLRGKAPPSSDFTGWLKQVIAYRQQQTPEQTLAESRAGLAEALRHGTTLLGDISGDGMTWPLLVEAPCRSVVFKEMLGLPARRAMPVWQETMKWLVERPDSDSCWSGLSPHAPYSVHHALIRAGAGNGFITAIHLAESLAEMELLDHRRGPFVDFLRELGAWEEDGLAPSLDWVLWQISRAPAALVAHGNFLSPNSAIPANVNIVYCPRTHAAFGHPPHPFREFLKLGIRVAIGTDSLASNPDLDSLAEARFIHERHPDFPGDQLLRMSTLSGAEALCRARETGSLEAGKSADLVVVPLPDREASDPHSLLFAPGMAENKPRRTLWRGEWRRLATE